MASKAKDVLRNEYVEVIRKALGDLGEDVLQVKSNELSIPVVGQDGNEYYVNFTVKVPNGSRDGDAYDGYAEAEDYELKEKVKREKREAAAKKKAEKIAKDKARREAAAAAKAKGE